jgi:hypothetical protein
MKTQEYLERLQAMEKTMEARKKAIIKQLSKRSEYPEVGDIFMFKKSKTLGLQWVVMKLHQKQNNEQFMLIVAADDNPIEGSKDIAISDDFFGPLILRCNQAIWIDKNDFNDIEKIRTGILENRHRQRAIDKVKQIFKNKIRSTLWQQETDIEPEYEEWMSAIYQDYKTLEQNIQEKSAEVIEIKKNKLSESFIIVLFLYPEHKLSLNIYLKNGKAFLKQIVPEDGDFNSLQGTFNFLKIGGYHFDFKYVDDECVCELKPHQISSIAKALDLPEFYQNWEATLENKKKCLSKLAKFFTEIDTNISTSTDNLEISLLPKKLWQSFDQSQQIFMTSLCNMVNDVNSWLRFFNLSHNTMATTFSKTPSEQNNELKIVVMKQLADYIKKVDSANDNVNK